MRQQEPTRSLAPSLSMVGSARVGVGVAGLGVGVAGLGADSLDSSVGTDSLADVEPESLLDATAKAPVRSSSPPPIMAAVNPMDLPMDRSCLVEFAEASADTGCSGDLKASYASSRRAALSLKSELSTP